MINQAADAIEQAALGPRFTLKEAREELFEKRPALAPYFLEAWEQLHERSRVVLVQDGEPNLFSFLPRRA